MTKELPGQAIVLGSTPLFEGLDPTLLQHVTDLAEPRQARAGEVVFRQGDAAEEMFVIEHGAVGLSIHVDDEKQVDIGRLGPGETFGEIALFDRDCRTATAKAMEECRLLRLGRQDFADAIRQHPELALHLLKILAIRLRAADSLIKETLSLNIPARLAEIVLKLAETYGRQTRKGIKIDAEFSDAELGDLAHLPPPVVDHQLRAWERRGWLKRSSGDLLIIDSERLRGET